MEDILNSQYSFCVQCGNRLSSLILEGQERLRCSECGWVHYSQLKVGAAVLIEKEEGLLLMQRSHSPFEGMWNLPAGYVEADEDPIQTATREAFEETGLQVEVGRLTGVYFFNDDPRGNGILVVYAGIPAGGELRPTEEALNPTFFSRQDVPQELAGGGHDKAIEAWIGG